MAEGMVGKGGEGGEGRSLQQVLVVVGAQPGPVGSAHSVGLSPGRQVATHFSLSISRSISYHFIPRVALRWAFTRFGTRMADRRPG